MTCTKIFFGQRLPVMIFFTMAAYNFMILSSDYAVEIHDNTIKTIIVSNFNEHQAVLNSEIDEYCKRNQLESYYLDGMRLSQTKTFYELMTGYNQNEYSFIIQQNLTVEEKEQRKLKKKIRPILANMIDSVVIKVQKDEQKQKDELLKHLTNLAVQEKTFQDLKNQVLKNEKMQHENLTLVTEKAEVVLDSCHIS